MIIPTNSVIKTDIRKLAVFTVNQKRYEITGRISHISTTHDDNFAIHVSNAEVLVDGKKASEIGYAWNGNAYTAEDCLLEFLASLTRKDGLCKKEYIHGMLDLFIADSDVPFVQYNGTEISKYVLSRTGEKLTLRLATDKFLYYANGNEDEVALMLRTDTHEVVSDNYFANEGIQDSLKNIGTGEESVICLLEPRR